MPNNRMNKAKSRDDLSKVLVHLTKKAELDNEQVSGMEVLKRIIKDNCLKGSQSIGMFCEAVCFYEVPHKNWDQLIDTNPNKREPYGIAIGKYDFWNLGGRPAIYTDNTKKHWPKDEEFRIIRTELKDQNPIDWTHEREWRIQGNLNLDFDSEYGWFLCVGSIHDAISFFKEFPKFDEIYTIELKRLLKRDEVHMNNTV